MQALPVTAPTSPLPPKREEAPDPQDARFGAVMASLLPFQGAPAPEPPSRPEAKGPELREAAPQAVGVDRPEGRAPAPKVSPAEAPAEATAGPAQAAPAPEAGGLVPSAPVLPEVPVGLSVPAPGLPAPGAEAAPLPVASLGAPEVPAAAPTLPKGPLPAPAPQESALLPAPSEATLEAPTPAPVGPLSEPLPPPQAARLPERSLRALESPAQPLDPEAPAPALSAEPTSETPAPGMKAEGSAVLPRTTSPAGQPAGSAELRPAADAPAQAPAAPKAAPAEAPAPHAEAPRVGSLKAESLRPEVPQSASPTPLHRDPLAGPLATAPAEVAATSHPTPSPVVAQLEGTLRWMVKGPVPEARLQLHPESLGKVSIELKVEQGQVHAKVLVQEPAALQALQEGRASLEAALKQSGLQLGSFDLQQGGNASRQAPDPRPLPTPHAPGDGALLRSTRQEAPPGAVPTGVNPRRIELYA